MGVTFLLLCRVVSDCRGSSRLSALGLRQRLKACGVKPFFLPQSTRRAQRKTEETWKILLDQPNGCANRRTWAQASKSITQAHRLGGTWWAKARNCNEGSAFSDSEQQILR